MPHKSREVEASLVRKGFRVAQSKHRHFIYFTAAGERTEVVTILSHGGNRDLSRFLERNMAQQCRLTRREFDDLIRCPMSQSQYESRLRATGRITQGGQGGAVRW